MKRFVIILTLIILCLSFTACKEEAVKETPTQPEKHTIAPSEIINNELEWAAVDCDIALNNAQAEPVLMGDDFDTFALCGSNDEDSYIVIKLSDDATKAVKTMPETENMPLLINNVEVAKINIDPANFNGEITFGENDTINQLQEYANIMRALY